MWSLMIFGKILKFLIVAIVFSFAFIEKIKNFWTKGKIFDSFIGFVLTMIGLTFFIACIAIWYVVAMNQ